MTEGISEMDDFDSKRGNGRGPGRGFGGSDGPRKPYAPREGGARKPYAPREGGSFGGERKPYAPREGGSFGGERKPYAPREGGFQRREGGYAGNREGGERRPYTPREGGSFGGERKPYAPREGGFQRREGGYAGSRDGGERRPYAPREGGSFGGERKPYAPREGGFQRREGGYAGSRDGGERRPYAPREGGSFGGERKPASYGGGPREGGFQRREGGYAGNREGGERRPYTPREGGSFGGERRPYAPREGGFPPRREGGFERTPRFERDETRWQANEGEASGFGKGKRQVEFMHPQADGWLVGPHAVKAALKAGRRAVKDLWVMETPVGELAELVAKYAGLNVEIKERSAFDSQFGDLVHQGIALQVGNLSQPALEDILSAKPKLMVALDQVTDPHNVGAVLRSCAAFGVGAVLMPDRRNASVTPVVAKSAAGGLEVVPVVEIGNMAQTLKMAKEAGYTVLGLAGEGDLALSSVTVDGPVCLVLGSEGDGLRRLTRELCDHLVKIPQDMGAVGSLNVSVAAGITLYALTR